MLFQQSILENACIILALYKYYLYNRRLIPFRLLHALKHKASADYYYHHNDDNNDDNNSLGHWPSGVWRVRFALGPQAPEACWGSLEHSLFLNHKICEVEDIVIHICQNTSSI